MNTRFSWLFTEQTLRSRLLWFQRINFMPLPPQQTRYSGPAHFSKGCRIFYMYPQQPEFSPEHVRWGRSVWSELVLIPCEEGTCYGQAEEWARQTCSVLGFARNSSNTPRSLFHSEDKKRFVSWMLGCACSFMPLTCLKTMYPPAENVHTATWVLFFSQHSRRLVEVAFWDTVYERISLQMTKG